MIIYNFGKKPVYINVGCVPDPNGGPGRGEVTLCLPADGKSGLDLSAYGMLTRDERMRELEQAYDNDPSYAKELNDFINQAGVQSDE